MKRIASLIVSVTILSAGNAGAFDWFGGRLSIGGGYGRAKPELPSEFKDSHQDGEMWSAHVKYFLNNDVSLVASYADLQPYARGNKSDVYRFRPVVASVRYNIFHHLPITPYLTAGAGYAWDNKHEMPGVGTVKWDGFTYQAGLGLEFFITEGTSLGVEGLWHSFEADANNSPRRLASLLGTANIYFGPGPSQKRTEEALQRQKEETARAQAEAKAAQQGQNTAQQQALTAEQAAAAAKAESDRKDQEAQAQIAQAQAEINAIKDMVARKDLKPVNFQTGSAELLVDSHDELDKVAEIAKKYPSLKLRVEGHTDSTGSANLNQKLSQKRSDSVRDYLVNSGGVPADQVVSAGFGQTRPIASNDTTEGRAQNRRVEFIFFLK